MSPHAVAAAVVALALLYMFPGIGLWLLRLDAVAAARPRVVVLPDSGERYVSIPWFSP